MPSFSAFNDSGCTTLWSLSFFWVKITIFYTSRYLVLILLLFGWYSTQPINTRTKKCRKYIDSCLRYFFLSHLCVFSAHYFAKLPPFRNSYPGSHGTHSSPFPTTCVPSFQAPEKKKLRIKFPSLASPCVELV